MSDRVIETVKSYKWTTGVLVTSAVVQFLLVVLAR